MRMDKEVVAPDPTDARKYAHMFVRDMSLLILPVDHLGCGERYGPTSRLLDLFRKLVGNGIQTIVHLTVMMKIEERRPVGQCIEHSLRHQEPVRDGIGESGPEVFIEPEDLPVIERHVGDTDDIGTHLD